MNWARIQIPVFWIVTSRDFTIQTSVDFFGFQFPEVKAEKSGRVLPDNQNSEIRNFRPEDVYGFLISEFSFFVG